MSFSKAGIGFSASQSSSIPVSSKGTKLYDMPSGNLTDGGDPFTFNGAMATAVITKSGGFDNIVVGNAGANIDSWMRQTNTFYAAKPLTVHLKVKIVALGAAPVLGFRTLGVGGIYSNFTNVLKSFYVNLLTGAITCNSTAGFDVVQKNGFTGAVAVGEVLDLYFTFSAFERYTLTVCRNIISGDSSTMTLTYPLALSSANDTQDLFYAPVILFDGTYKILEHDFVTGDYDAAVVAFMGDSLMSGGRQHYYDSLQYQLQQIVPYRIANFAAGTCLLAGMQSVLRHTLRAAPKVIVFDNGLDALFGNDCDPTDPQFAAWDAAMKTFVDTIIGAGIEPVLCITSCTFLFPDTRLDTFQAWWTANYPTRKFVRMNASDVEFDGTHFHYNPATNGRFRNKIRGALATLGY
jgi:hypothetical protein